MPFHDATIGLDYSSPAIARSDLVVELNGRTVRSDLEAMDGGFVYTIPGSEISEAGSLYFKTPGGVTFEVADVF